MVDHCVISRNCLGRSVHLKLPMDFVKAFDYVIIIEKPLTVPIYCSILLLIMCCISQNFVMLCYIKGSIWFVISPKWKIITSLQLPSVRCGGMLRLYYSMWKTCNDWYFRRGLGNHMVWCVFILVLYLEYSSIYIYMSVFVCVCVPPQNSSFSPRLLRKLQILQSCDTLRRNICHRHWSYALML